MGFFKKIWDAIFGSSEGGIRDREGIYFYVKCGKCGAPVRVRADKYHDLVRDYDTGEFEWNKGIMDGTCFNLMHASVRFDPSRRVIEKEIEGGEFIDYEEYQELVSSETPEPEDAPPGNPEEGP
jgi:hypothetical protein